MSLLNKASLIMTPNAVKQSKVYSIIPTNGNGDLTFTRGTNASATLSGANGLIELVPYNLLTFSEQFDNSIWQKTRCTIIANSTNSPNLTLTADTLVGDSIAGENYVFVPQNATIGVPNVLSVYIKPIDITLVKLVSFTQAGQARFSLVGSGSVTFENGICTNSTIESLPNGWYRISTKITPTATASNNIGISTSTLGIVGNCFYIWGAQLVQGSVPKDYFFTTDRLNVPRLNYDVAGGCPSLLLEPQRTNSLLNSVWSGSSTSPTSWSLNGTGVSTLVTSIKNPNVGAYNFVSTAIARIFFFQTQTFTINTTSCLSVYVESASVPVQVQFILAIINAVGTPTYFKNNVSITATTNIEAGNTYSIVYAASATTTISEVRVGLHNTGIVGNVTLSMPQLETGVSSIAAYNTSFIPTTTGAVTRNADVFLRNNIYTNGLITSAGGTWFIEINNNIILSRDAGTLEGLSIQTSSVSTSNGLGIRTLAGAASRLSIIKRILDIETTVYQTLSNTIKVVIKWDGSNLDAFVNGSKIHTSTFTAVIMDSFVAKTLDVPKYIKSTMLFPTPLTDTECIALTSSNNYTSYENMALNLNYVIQ